MNKEQPTINSERLTLDAKRLYRVEYLHMPEGTSSPDNPTSPEASAGQNPAEQQTSVDNLPKTLPGGAAHHPLVADLGDDPLAAALASREAQLTNPITTGPAFKESTEKAGIFGIGRKDRDKPIDEHDSSIEHTATDRTEGDLSQEELDKKRAQEELDVQEETKLPVGPIEQPASTTGTSEEPTVQTATGGGSENLPPGPRTAEAAPNPEESEIETSPERGRKLVLQIIELEGKEYEERYNAENGPKLNRLYKELQQYVRAICRDRNERDPWDPFIRDNAHRVTGIKPREQNGEQEQSTPETLNTPETLPERSVEQLLTLYHNDTIVGPERAAVESDLLIYFRNAKRLHILDGVDNVLNPLLGQLIDEQGQQVIGRQARAIVREGFEYAQEVAQDSYELNNPNEVKYRGIGTAYLDWAQQSFRRALSGQDQLLHREGEYLFNQEKDTEGMGETYWRSGSYPKTYVILAKTSEQFRRAADTFLAAGERRAMGLDPGENFDRFRNFKDYLGEAMDRQVEAGEITAQFALELRQELEGHGFIKGGNYSKETYNPDTDYQFMNAMALHEGPQRWIRITRSGEGKPAAFLWKFDNDSRILLFHNSGGSRGQITNDTITQHFLQDEIGNILIEEGMGIIMKDYDSRGGNLTINNPQLRLELAREVERIRKDLKDGKKLDQLSERDQKIYNAFNSNIERIGIHQKLEDFKGLYEGFDDGSAHIKAFQIFGNLDSNQLPESIKRSVSIGKVQTLLRGHEGKNKDQLIKEINKLIAGGQLDKKDKRNWESAYNQAKASFGLAFEMVGATGEKVRRGGGVIMVERTVEGRKIVDYIPDYLVEKFVQFAVTRCKIQYSNSSAEERVRMVEIARKNAIQQIKENGFAAKLTIPKVLFDNNGNVIGEGEEETIKFKAASESIYSRWTSHTYWGYQQENRHMILSPDVFATAKRIRAGLTKPEEEKNGLLAVQLLILDPTLKNVKELNDEDMGPGENPQVAEVMILENAVENSNQGHWRIVRDIYDEFISEEGNPLKSKIGYNLEDYGGYSRYLIRFRNYVAVHGKRFARRYGAELANSPMNISSMPDIWGQDGVLGAIEMFADPIGEIASQRVASQFAITKFVDQMKYAWVMFGALVGHVDSQKALSIEGLFEKPTNNSDKLVKLWEKIKAGGHKHEENQNDFFYAIMDSFGRLDIVLKTIRTMESDTRNAQGALWSENPDKPQEVFIDGKINPALATDRNTGSSRHSERIFFDMYIDWLLSDKTGGGQKTYASEVKIYEFLNAEYYYFDKNGKKQTDGRKWRDWLFDKMAR